MSYTRTVTEFSSSRKLRNDYGDNARVQANPLKSSPLAYSSLGADAVIKPHTAFFGRDDNGKEAYYIQFNVGDFESRDIAVSNQGAEDTNHVQRQFNREFTLPEDVDPKSVKLRIDEKSRELTLVAEIIPNYHAGKTSASSLGSAAASSLPVGSVHENKTSTAIEYQINLGSPLRDGKLNIDVPNSSTLVVKVAWSGTDSYGETNLDLRKQIKLPAGANANAYQPRLDSLSGVLTIIVPLR